jgi:hypothetical protein
MKTFYELDYTRAVWKVRGLTAVHRCYEERGGDLRQVAVVGVM